MGDDANDLAVLDDFLQVLLDGLASEIVLPFLGSLGESLLLTLVPIQKQWQIPSFCATTFADVRL